MSAIKTPPLTVEGTKPSLRKILPEAGSFTNDLVASLVVFLIALPLSMGIAIASGLPPALGLITGIVGGIVVGAISGSPLQVSGPAAGLAVIVFQAAREFGVPMLGAIVLGAGVIQWLAGRFKMGQWFRAISPAVVYGMLAGIGILIVAGQFHVMVDDKPRSSGLTNLIAIPESIYKAFFPAEGATHHFAAAIGVLTFASILLWNKFRPRSLKVIPGSLIGVLLGTAVTALLQLPIKHVDIPNNLFSIVSLPTADNFAALLQPRALLTVFSIALIASAETLLSAAAVDRMQSRVRTDYDKELTAQGVGNMLCGLFGSLPMTGVIVRSSANVQAGARTRLSAIMHGVWLLALCLCFPSVLRLIPMASLAGVLVFTGIKLVDLNHLRKLRNYGNTPVVIYAATLTGIVAVDLLTGVLVGIALTIAKLLWKASRLDVITVTAAGVGRTELYLSGIATFLRLPQLLKTLDSIPTDHQVHVHIEHLYYIDHTCLDALKAAAEQREARGGRFEVHWGELTQRYQLNQLAMTASVRNS